MKPVEPSRTSTYGWKPREIRKMVKTRLKTGIQSETTTTQECTCGFEGCVGCRYGAKTMTPKTRKPTRTNARDRGVTTPISFVDIVVGTPRCNPTRLSYAEAVTGTPRTPSQTGCSTTGITRGHLAEDVTPDKSVTSDNLLFQVENDIDEEVYNEQTHRPNSTITEPFTNKNNKQKWTIEEKLDLYRCYCKALSKGLKVTKGTYEIWREENPTNRPNMNPTTLSNQ